MMSKTREFRVLGGRLILLILLLTAAALGTGSATAADLIAWVGVGPRVVVDGQVVGGNVVQDCNCTGDQAGQDCPQPTGMICSRKYHGCVNSGGTLKKYCVGSGNASYCGGGGGDQCPVTQYSECTGTACN